MTPNRPSISAMLRERSGVTNLEWALVVGAFMLMIISIIDLVRYVAGVQSVASITAQAGRACLINPGSYCIAGPLVGNAIWSTLPVIAPMLDDPNFTVQVVNSHSNGINVISVTVSYQFTAWAPWLSMLNTTSSSPISESATYFN